MTVHCAWCDSRIAVPVRGRAAAAGSRVSDGICPTCLDHQLAALSRQVPAEGTLGARRSLR